MARAPAAGATVIRRTAGDHADQSERRCVAAELDGAVAEVGVGGRPVNRKSLSVSAFRDFGALFH